MVVVGGGNAGFAAAHAAAERGRRVVVLEKGAAEVAGGNSYFTAGATRIAHDGLADLLDFVEPDPRHARAVVPPYPRDEYAADLARVTGGRNDPALTAMLVDEAYNTVRWLHGLGMRYRLLYERQTYEAADGRLVFFGGLHVGNVDGGVGLIADHTAIAATARSRGPPRHSRHRLGHRRPPGRRCSWHRSRRTGRGRCPLRRARRGWLRGRRRAAPPPPGAGLGARPRTRDAAQHRRHDHRRDTHRGGDERRLGRGPRGPVGCPPPIRRCRRPPAHQSADPSELPARHPRQRRRRTLRRRGSRLPQLHLRQLRACRARATGCHRLPTVRRHDAAAAAHRGVRHAGRLCHHRRHHRGPRPAHRDRACPSRCDDLRLQRQRRRRRPVRPRGQGRPPRRAAAAEEQLGRPARDTTVPRVSR